MSTTRVGNFRQKNNSAEDGIDGTNAYFRRNSGCSAEQKPPEFRSEPFRGRENNTEFRSVEQKEKQTLGILFRTIPRKRKQFGILFRTIPRKRKQLGISFRVEKKRGRILEERPRRIAKTELMYVVL